MFVMYSGAVCPAACAKKPRRGAGNVGACHAVSFCLLATFSCLRWSERANESESQRARATKSKTHKRLHMLCCEVEVDKSPPAGVMEWALKPWLRNALREEATRGGLAFSRMCVDILAYVPGHMLCEQGEPGGGALVYLGTLIVVLASLAPSGDCQFGQVFYPVSFCVCVCALFRFRGERERLRDSVVCVCVRARARVRARDSRLTWLWMRVCPCD